MTDFSAFENPEISSPQLSAAELQKIVTLQGEILRRAVICNSFSTLLDELCLLVESFTPNAVAALMLYCRDRDGLFVENAPSLGSEALTEAFNGIRLGDGSCGNAVYHNEPMYVCNTSEDSRWDNLADVAARFNIFSCFSFPVLNAAGEAIGSFSISSFEPRSPNGFHRALLEACTSICGVILQRREADELRRRMLEEQMRTERIESVGILAGGIAHDFNNLLMAIMGNVDMTQSTLPSGAEKESLQLAMKAIERASDLTRQLLTLAKGQSPVRVPNDIRSIIRESAELALHGSNVSFEIAGVEHLASPIIHVDGGQIGQLVQNLVINARQAMSRGGVVSIHCSEEDLENCGSLPDGRYLRVSVTDDGEGIARERLERIFEPYYTTREQGSGLGLFLCYSIANAHGGKIEVQSEPGMGTCFTFYLPLDGVHAVSVENNVNDETAIAANVLIMDDDRLVRKTLSRILKMIGCNVWEAADGNEAIQSYTELRNQGQSIDLTILDLTVPGGMGGVEAMEELRRFDPDSKIVVSSGYSSGAISPERLAGFDARMVKPYRIAELREVIAQLVG